MPASEIPKGWVGTHLRGGRPRANDVSAAAWLLPAHRSLRFRCTLSCWPTSDACGTLTLPALNQNTSALDDWMRAIPVRTMERPPMDVSIAIPRPRYGMLFERDEERNVRGRARHTVACSRHATKLTAFSPQIWPKRRHGCARAQPSGFSRREAPTISGYWGTGWFWRPYSPDARIVDGELDWQDCPVGTT